MLNRRKFLKYTGACGLGLGLPSKVLAKGIISVDDPLTSYPKREWEDLYRDELVQSRGSATGYAFHCSNCQGNCAWQVGSEDGKITREEQLAQYPQVNWDIPDNNPRGCNKGAIHSQAMYADDRLKKPLKRVGERGEGKWKEISWDQALTEISEKVVDTITEHGPGSLMIHTGTGILSQGRRSGPLRLGSLLGAARIYPSSAVGDMFTGATLAFGVPNIGHSLDAWFDMDYILLWGINPNVTRIPDAHYLWEGKYNGAKVVTISPDYNPTSIHADEWVPVKPGTDSYLAMSMVNVIFNENLYKSDFVQEQTDLPFLVRKDNGKLLRGSDMVKKGGDEVFYMWDKATSQAVQAPGTRGSENDTLRLGNIRPALVGSFEVLDKDGKTIAVTTAFEISRKEAAKFSPESTQSQTGIHPNIVRKIAREYAKAKKAGITIGFSLHKYSWGILACWAQGLICALTGHAAETGGLDTENQWSLSGIGPLASPKPARFESGVMSEWMAGKMWESFDKHYDDAEFKDSTGMAKADLLNLAKESLDKDWLKFYGNPKARIIFADNLFRRNKSSEEYKISVLDDTDIYVNVNFRMDSSADLADYVLPGQSHYEGWDIRGEVGYHRFVNLVVPPEGLEPVGESKSEWEICSLISQYMEKAAKKKGVTEIDDLEFKVTRTFKAKEGDKEVDKTKTGPVIRDLVTLHKDFTMENKLNTDKDVVKWLLENIPAFIPWKFEDAVQRGFIILNKNAGFTSPLYATKPYHSFESQVYLRRPYPTVSGRQQYYIDQEVFLRIGSPTPTARKPLHPKKFPLKFYTPHTRWGIHSTWRTNKYMMRMQRGAPHVSLNVDDAKTRGITDGDEIIVHNNVGEFIAMAKVNPTVMPGTLMMDHAWEPHQFKNRKGLNSLVAGALSPLELAGNWGHLKFGAEWDGNQLALESSVDVKKV